MLKTRTMAGGESGGQTSCVLGGRCSDCPLRAVSVLEDSAVAVDDGFAGKEGP